MSELPPVTDNGAHTAQAARTQARNVPISWMKGGNLPEASRNDGETQPTSHEQSLEAERKEMLAELDEAHRALMAQITALEMSGSTDEKIASEITDLKNRAQKNRDLCADIKNPFSGRSIESLKADVSIQTGQGAANATNNAVSAVIYANSGGAMGGAAAIALEQARRETTSFLERTAQNCERRTEASAALAAKYGIDVSEEMRGIAEDKRNEEEAKTPEEKLGWRIKRLHKEKSLHHKNLNNPDLTPEERAAEEEKLRKAEEELREAEKLKEKTQAAQKGTEQNTEHNDAGFNQRQQDSYIAHWRDVSRQRYQHLLTDADSIRAEARDVVKRDKWADDKSLNAAADAARPIIEASRAMAAEGKRATEADIKTKPVEEKSTVTTAFVMSPDPQPTVIAPANTPAATKTVAEVSTPKRG